MAETQHRPVLLKEVLDALQCRPGGIYVDGTFGGGGHGRAILEGSGPDGRLIGMDWDLQAMERAREALAPYGPRAILRDENFRKVGEVLESLAIPKVDGILVDLGLSSDQLEDPERGMSFRWDGPLDMRMSQETKLTAANLLQRLPVAEIAEIFFRYGEERYANRIARAIVQRRQKRPLRTTGELVEVITRSVPFRRGRIHPATRVFQALRIVVNEELKNLEVLLDQCPEILAPGGRVAVISFHSLEDRIVKERFRRWAKGSREEEPTFRLLTPKPLTPSPEEVWANPRSRSAKMRVAEKLPDHPRGEEDG